MSTHSDVDLNGNGEKVLKPTLHTLWQPRTDSGASTPEPLWYLRVHALKDSEGQGDCPSRRFAFKSLHHLTHAANQLRGAFGKTFNLNTCGVETPDAMGGRVNDGRSENITIEYQSDAERAPNWKTFLVELKRLEDEWDHEGMSVL